MDTLIQDLRYGSRTLLKAPGFTVLAVLTLAIGIGANTALFSVVNGVLLRPLPYPDPERLVMVHGTDVPRGNESANVSPPDVVDFRTQSRSFEGIAALSQGDIVLTGRGEPVRLAVMIATANVFGVLGARPLVGRFFLPEEEQPGRHRVAVLGHRFWTRRFGADPGIVGRTLTLAGHPYTVVGVLPAGFILPDADPDLWRPVPIDPESRGGHWLNAIGRLRPGVSLEQAQVEMDTITRRLEQQHPDTNTGRHTRLEPLKDAVVRDARAALYALFGAVGFVLLIACANVANLILVRASGRRREIAVRAALGAGRLRIVRQLLTESLLLFLCGGLAGTLLALWGTDLVVALASESLPRSGEIVMDLSVLAFSLALSTVAGILFGLAPALQHSRVDVERALRDDGRNATAGRGRSRVLGALAVTQVALSLVLLTGAGLLIKSLWTLLRVDPGFRAERVLTLDLALPESRYPDEGRMFAFYTSLLDRLDALPGVQSAGAVNILPLSGSNSCDGFSVIEHPPAAVGRQPCAEARYSTPGYFPALGIPLVRGRSFTEADDGNAPRVALINQAMARLFFPGEDPIGKHVVYNAAPRAIVGIVGDVRHFGLDTEAPPEFYLPHQQLPMWEMTLAVRASSDSVPLVAAVRGAIAALDRDLAVANVRTISDLLHRSVARPRFRAVLLGAFAATALALAAIGIFGVLAHGVAQRTREIGIRMALGARRRAILGMMLGQGIRLTLAGVGLGLAASIVLTRFLSGLLFGVSPTDPITLSGVTLLLTLVALLACVVPARRATRVDPMTALRCE
ncbi:MAG TPA: ABC transporter permease [Candidatus Polarisedimenticolia bacterium]|jgi:putative ABC transport system permease protein|nr:ABC transporter permease [Candidatus Polarisedimenticolia bacterium]